MTVEVTRDDPSGEWVTEIPTDYWEGFKEYAREVRLSFRKQGTGQNTIRITLPAGLLKADIDERIGYFFDGIAEVTTSE